MTILKFPMQPVIDLYQRVLVAPKMRPTYDQQHLEEPPRALWLVKDEGVYLMSAAADREPSEGVVYALGYDPDRDPSWYDRARGALGGDDFLEAIPIEWVANAVTAGESYLRLSVTKARISLVLVRGGVQ